MTSTSVPYQVPYQNQLQFNLGVPLTAQNLKAQFNRPSPIFVERVGGQHGLPVKFIQKQTSGVSRDPNSSSFNYSALSEDKMEMMSILAKRDLRNRNVQLQIARKSHSSESLSPTSSPSRTRRHQINSCERFARQDTTKPRKSLTVKQADKNRRLGAVQTPPPRRPVSHFKMDDSMLSARNTSINVTKESDVYFPAKPILPEGSTQPKDEIEKLQLEIEGYLLLIEHIGQRAISEPGAKFLHLPGKGNRKDEFLVEEENMDRVKVRIEEQNTRLTRNLYNLKLKVNQIQRDTAHTDLSKPARRNQLSAQLGIVYRGAVKSLQTFVNQLPYQNLREGIPSNYLEFAVLLRQLTALSSLIKVGKQSEGKNSLLAVLDRVDSLNAKWHLETNKAGSVMDKKDKKSTITKDWVSDTKVDKNIFVMKGQPEFKFPLETGQFQQQHQRLPMQRGRPKKRAVGKENKHATVSAGGRKQNELRAAVASLLQQKAKVTNSSNKEQYINNGVAWDVEMGKQLLGQNHRKAPFEHIAQRDKAHRTAVLSNQEKRYADTAATTNQKMFQNQPHSIPDSARHKEVNFELDGQSPMPWIPPGRYSRSRSLSSEPKAQSRSPFYLQEMNPEDVKSIFPDKRSVQVKKTDRDVPNYGVHSLPSDKILRSADVSSSFIDEVEHRLLQRLAGRVAGENKGASRSSAKPYRQECVSADSAVDMYSDMDEPLDTSDLREKVRMDAVSAVDAPTLENMKLRLTEMQREQREIRQRWSTVHFADTKPKSRIFASSYVQSERFREPPAIEVTRMSKTDGSKSSQIPVTEWKDKEEPMIFTKPCVSSKVTYHHTVDNTKEDELQLESHMIHVKPPKKLVTLKQTTVEKISADRDRFGSYLRKRSHHPSGKFDPWKLVEEISDEILSDCLADVAAEVESISEEIANHMYKSEFVVERNQSETVLHTQKFDPKLDQRLTVDIVNKPMSSGFRYSPQKLVQVEPIETKKTSGSVDRQAAETPSILASGDQQQISAEKAEAEKSPTQRSPSTPGSPAHFSPGKLSPVFSAVEPSLENMSLFLQRVDSSSERKEKGGGDVEEEVGEKEKKYEDDYQEDSNEESYSNDDDDDGDEYEQDDFEDVTEDELQ